ncbi:bacteriorhodopsin [Halovenus rubra]|uniref:Bacteriorhodopsin n=2 Tax=Halovenus rubra TaxID=869890 RepID=A0ABD5X2P7_9EURY|nr:bacteriorhodopsin [Halovenus rubra]
MAQPGSEALWLWLGTAGMFLGMLYFIIRGWNVNDSRREKFYIATIMITAIAFVNYLSMATGFGLIEITYEGETYAIYWARYTDWLITTPLLLYDLALLAGADRNTIGTLIGLDVLMIGTGAIATLATAPLLDEVVANRLVWWGVSTGLLLVLLYFLFTSLTERVKDLPASTQSTFSTLRNLILVLWLVYPVWWLVGTEGVGVLPGPEDGLYFETAGFMVLDLAAKVGFGIILLRSHQVLDAVKERTTSTTGETGDTPPAP